MAKSKSLYRVFNTIFPFADLVYILQLEEYSSLRLIRWLPRFFFRRNIQQREHLVWTARAKGTVAASAALWIGVVWGGLTAAPTTTARLLFLLFALLSIPLFVLIINSALALLEEIPRKRIRKQAAQLVASNAHLKTVVIAGSYGKTTTKNFIHQLTKYSLRAQMIPGNINTPGGIANWVLSNLKPDTELLIAEVDTYQQGEIAKSCEILRPDIAVLTNIGDQHLERFASINDLTSALLEVFIYAKPDAVRITIDDTKGKIAQVLPNTNVTYVSSPKLILTYGFMDLDTKNLTASNCINLSLALEVSRQLRIPETIVHDTVPKLELPERRRQQTTVLGYEGINDSYNISFSTAQASITEALELAKNARKKLLVITAGIPELSPENRVHNQELGELLAKFADHTIILNSCFAKEIRAGFKDNNKYTLVSSLNNFIASNAQNFKNTEWYLLLQPELNDLYY